MKESLRAEDRIAMAEYRKEIALQRLKAAEVLLREGLYGDAISKLYFAVHAMARAVLILYDIRASTHEGVKTMLSKKLIREARAIPEDFAKKYSILKALREDADYEDFINYSKNDAEEALEMAREFIEKLSVVIEETRKKIQNLHK